MTSRISPSSLPRLAIAGLVALLACASLASDLWAQASLGSQRVGTSSGTFLKIGVGARAVAMGGAFVAVANDPTTLYWNPAGIAGQLRTNIFVSHVEWPADISYDFIGILLPSEKLGGSIGIQIGALSTDIEETTELQPFGTGQTFTYSDYVIGLSYARRFTDKLLIGLTGKYVHENLGKDVGGTTVDTWLIDVGSIYYIGVGSLRIGVTLANFGPNFEPNGEFESPTGEVRQYDSASPPTQFRWGVAWEPIENQTQRLTTSFEISQPADNSQQFKGGLEWTGKDILSLRTGYDFNADEIKWSAGAGVKVPINAMRGSVDYSYSDGGVLGAIHQVTLGVRF